MSWPSRDHGSTLAERNSQLENPIMDWDDEAMKTMRESIQGLRLLVSAVCLFMGLMATIGASGAIIVFSFDRSYLPLSGWYLPLKLSAAAATAFLIAAVCAPVGQRFRPLTLVFSGCAVVMVIVAPFLISLGSRMLTVALTLFFFFTVAACSSFFFDRRSRMRSGDGNPDTHGNADGASG